MSDPFVHLHVHTEYSLLDGLSKIDKLVARAKQHNATALAITDHGTMHGVIQFYRACNDNGIKPILGIESYLAKRDRYTHDPSERQPFHLLLLAKNQTGYLNLLKLASEAQLTGFYGKPRVDHELLAEYHEGIIATSGCLAAEIPRAFADKSEAAAVELIGKYRDIFGPDNFFLELQSHEIPELRRLNEWLIGYGRANGIPLLATNDVHYVLPEDFDAHDTLLCIQTQSHKSDAKRMRMTDPSYHLRAPEEMWSLFGDSAPEALRNTLLVAEMVEQLDLNNKGYHLPIFPVPDGYTADAYLRQMAVRGAQWRYGAEADSATIQTRIDYELGVIHTMGFDTYFLIVWDLCQYARNANIWWNVRGSGAGSVVAYCLGITSIDPIRNGLIFERFLNPGRITMPDIDMDFPDDERSRMIDYAVRKYGEDKVAAIITFNTLKARAAIKDVARVLNYPLDSANTLTKMVPAIPSHPVTLAQCLSDDPEYAVPDLKRAYESDDTTRQVIDTALTLEGVTRGVGTHAAGVIIGDEPLIHYLPLHRPTTNNTDAVPIKRVTQFPMEICEGIGLLKIDFLGLSTLSVMRRACELIEKHHGIRYTLQNIPYRPDPNDPELTRMVEQAFDLIGSGEVTGVFQLESQGMRRMLVEMKPRTFEHIVAAIALYRPGPLQFIPMYIRRMHGQELIEYLHPKLESILSETYGIVTYQEQLLRIGAELFGYSLGDADLMRRAVSKKKAKDLAKHKEIFIAKGPENGVLADVAEKIFDQVEYFAAYGFNRSHAADYAVITCQTAFLKCHYAPEYYTALLTVQRDKIEDVTLFTSDCRRLGIPILPPELNVSELDFTIAEENGKRGIRFGLGAIKGVGDKVNELILDERLTGGPYRSLSDFCYRVDLSLMGSKPPLEALIKVGVFDGFGERHRLLGAAERMIGISKKYWESQKTGQAMMFDNPNGDTFGAQSYRQSDSDLLDSVGNVPLVTAREKLGWEKELIGLYVSSHPLDSMMSVVRDLPNLTYSTYMKAESDAVHDRPVTLVGMVSNIRTVMTKKSDMMAILTVEDMFGTFDAVLFPRTWGRYSDLLQVGQAYIFRGKADTKRGGEPQVMVESISETLGISSSADDTLPAALPTVVSVHANQPAAPPTSDEPPAHRPDGYAPNGNSNGNGNNNGKPARPNGAETIIHDEVPEPVAADDPAAVPTWDANADNNLFLDEEEHPGRPGQRVTVQFAPCLDESKVQTWIRRIERIHRKLLGVPGPDELVFKVPDQFGVQTLRFDDRIDFEPMRQWLEHELKSPDESITVERVPGQWNN